MQVNMKDGRRWSSADAFLSKDVRRRPNLTHDAQRDSCGACFSMAKRAIGVEYTDKPRARTHQAHAPRVK